MADLAFYRKFLRNERDINDMYMDLGQSKGCPQLGGMDNMPGPFVTRQVFGLGWGVCLAFPPPKKKHIRPLA